MNKVFYGGEVVKKNDFLWLYMKNNKAIYEIHFDGIYSIKRYNRQFWKKKFNTIDDAIQALYEKLKQVHKSWKRKYDNNSYIVWNKGLNSKTSVKVRMSGVKSSKTKKLQYKSGEIVVWNKGLAKDNNASLKRISEGRIGKNNPIHKVLNDPERLAKWKKSLSVASKGKNTGSLNNRHGVEKANLIKEKQSNSAKVRKVHGHTGIKHSEESKQKMREATARRISNGEFPQTDTRPMREFAKILNKLNMMEYFKKEFFVKYYSIDFACEEKKIAFEVDGDFWHANPKKYPNGAVYKSQKRNERVQKAKTTYLQNRGWQIFRFWEDDIINNNENIIYEVKKILENVWGF